MLKPRKVQGSATQAKPLIIGKDTVYVHTNIVQLKDEEGKLIEDLFEYDEVQYRKDDYIALISNKQDLTAVDGIEIAETVIGVALDQDDLVDTIAELALEISALQEEVEKLKNTKEVE